MEGLDLPKLEQILKESLGEGLDHHRLVHGRGGRHLGLESITLDCYGPCVVCFVHRALGEALLAELLSCLQANFLTGLLQDRSARPAIWQRTWGDLSLPVLAHEEGLVFELELGEHQNIGFFPDFRAGRRWVRKVFGEQGERSSLMVTDKKEFESRETMGKPSRVLNLFAYTCSISVAAIDGGATSVLNVDMSRKSLETGRRFHHINRQDLSRVQFLKANILKSWGRIERQGPYDLVVIDPPTDQGTCFKAERDYQKVFRRLAQFLPEGCRVLACLNSPRHTREHLLEWASVSSRFRFEDWLLPDVDHCDSHSDAGLKMAVLRVGAASAEK